MKLQILSFGLCGKERLFMNELSSFFSFDVHLVTASRPYARYAQPFYPSRMAFHFHWLSPFRLPVDPHRVRRIYIVALVCTTYLSREDKWDSAHHFDLHCLPLSRGQVALHTTPWWLR